MFCEMDPSILKNFGKMREVLNQLIIASKLEGQPLLEFLKKKTPFCRAWMRAAASSSQ